MVQKKKIYSKDIYKSEHKQGYDIDFASFDDYFPLWELNNYVIWHDYCKYYEETKEHLYYDENANVDVEENLILCKEGPGDMYRYYLDAIFTILLPILFIYVGLYSISILLVFCTWHIFISDPVTDEDKAFDRLSDYMFSGDFEEREYKLYGTMFTDNSIEYYQNIGPYNYCTFNGINPEKYACNYKVYQKLNDEVIEGIQNGFPENYNIKDFIFDKEFYMHKFYIKRVKDYFIKNIEIKYILNKNLNINNNLAFYKYTDLFFMLNKYLIKNNNMELLNYYEGLYASDFFKSQLVDGIKDLDFLFYNDFILKYKIIKREKKRKTRN